MSHQIRQNALSSEEFRNDVWFLDACEIDGVDDEKRRKGELAAATEIGVEKGIAIGFDKGHTEGRAEGHAQGMTEGVNWEEDLTPWKAPGLKSGEFAGKEVTFEYNEGNHFGPLIERIEKAINGIY